MSHEGLRAKTDWLGIRIMCPSGATCLSADCCFSELTLSKSNSVWWSSYKADLIIISLKNNLFSPWYSWKVAELALNNNHSLILDLYHCLCFYVYLITCNTAYIRMAFILLRYSESFLTNKIKTQIEMSKYNIKDMKAISIFKFI